MKCKQKLRGTQQLTAISNRQRQHLSCIASMATYAPIGRKVYEDSLSAREIQRYWKKSFGVIRSVSVSLPILHSVFQYLKTPPIVPKYRISFSIPSPAITPPYCKCAPLFHVLVTAGCFDLKFGELWDTHLLCVLHRMEDICKSAGAAIHKFEHIYSPLLIYHPKSFLLVIDKMQLQFHSLHCLRFLKFQVENHVMQLHKLPT